LVLFAPSIGLAEAGLFQVVAAGERYCEWGENADFYGMTNKKSNGKGEKQVLCEDDEYRVW
jgi:hypothetical protein